MFEFMHLCRHVPCALGTAALDESLLPVVQVALVLGLTTVSWGVWAARALSRSWRRGAASPDGDPLAPCRLHDWLRMDDRSFVCLRCGFQAGSATAREWGSGG